MAKKNKKKLNERREFVSECNPEALFADGFNDAIIGYVERIGQPIIALYNKEKIIDILVNTNGMEREDAEEHYEFNILWFLCRGNYSGICILI